MVFGGLTLTDWLTCWLLLNSGGNHFQLKRNRKGGKQDSRWIYGIPFTWPPRDEADQAVVGLFTHRTGFVGLLPRVFKNTFHIQKHWKERLFLGPLAGWLVGWWWSIPYTFHLAVKTVLFTFWLISAEQISALLPLCLQEVHRVSGRSRLMEQPVGENEHKTRRSTDLCRGRRDGETVVFHCNGSLNAFDEMLWLPVH